MSSRTTRLLLTVAVLAACEQAPISPDLEPPIAFAEGGSAACPIPADFVATDEASLLAAVGAAVGGDVIGLAATIPLSARVDLDVADVTLTCALAGAGLVAGPGFAELDLLRVRAPRVTVDRLRLDGSGTARGAIVAFSPADGLRFTRNHVRGGPSLAAFFAGTEDATVTDNVFENALASAVSGLHMQSNVSRSVIARNVARTLVTSSSPIFGGFRIRDGAGVVIADNIAEGPWLNSFAMTSLGSTQVERNRGTGAANLGVLALTQNRNVFRNNRFSGAGSAASAPPFGLVPAGLAFLLSCNNTLIGNNLNGNFGNVGVIFHRTTGGNVMNANQNVVFDDGDFDCDGDGVSDPNIITGKSLKGGFGGAISDAASTTGGMK